MQFVPLSLASLLSDASVLTKQTPLSDDQFDSLLQESLNSDDLERAVLSQDKAAEFTHLATPELNEGVTPAIPDMQTTLPVEVYKLDKSQGRLLSVAECNLSGSNVSSAIFTLPLGAPTVLPSAHAYKPLAIQRVEKLDDLGGTSCPNIVKSTEVWEAFDSLSLSNRILNLSDKQFIDSSNAEPLEAQTMEEACVSIAGISTAVLDKLTIKAAIEAKGENKVGDSDRQENALNSAVFPLMVNSFAEEPVHFDYAQLKPSAANQAMLLEGKQEKTQRLELIENQKPLRVDISLDESTNNLLRPTTVMLAATAQQARNGILDTPAIESIHNEANTTLNFADEAFAAPTVMYVSIQPPLNVMHTSFRENRGQSTNADANSIMTPIDLDAATHIQASLIGTAAEDLGMVDFVINSSGLASFKEADVERRDQNLVTDYFSANIAEGRDTLIEGESVLELDKAFDSKKLAADNASLIVEEAAPFSLSEVATVLHVNATENQPDTGSKLTQEVFLPHFAKLIAQKTTEVNSSEKAESVSVSLGSSSLGDVEVVLKKNETGTLFACLQFDKGDTLAWFQSHREELVDTLRSLGFEGDNISMELSSGSNQHKEKKSQGEYLSLDEQEIVRASYVKADIKPQKISAATVLGYGSKLPQRYLNIKA